MLKISCVPLSVGICVGSVALGSATLITTPNLIATNHRPATHTKSGQCRVLFATVVSSKQMGAGFYRRKASQIRALQLRDRQLRTFQSRFSTTFNQLEAAKDNRARRTQLGKQAGKLVSQLNRYCFK